MNRSRESRVRVGDTFGHRVVLEVTHARTGRLQVRVRCSRGHERWISPRNLFTHPGCSRCPNSVNCRA